MNVNSTLIVSIAAVLLSLVFSYIPGLRVAYGKLSTEAKRLIMLGLLVLVCAAVFALQCWSIITTNLTCNKQGVIDLVQLFIVALVSNQGTYLITPQAKDVKAL